jgi:hypothetical protein
MGRQRRAARTIVGGWSDVFVFFTKKKKLGDWRYLFAQTKKYTRWGGGWPIIPIGQGGEVYSNAWQRAGNKKKVVWRSTHHVPASAGVVWRSTHTHSTLKIANRSTATHGNAQETKKGSLTIYTPCSCECGGSLTIYTHTPRWNC